MNILLSGDKGFIGSNLVKKLLNHKIIGVDLKDGKDILNPNILEEAFSNNIDVVIHLAAIAGVGYSLSNSEEVLTNNIIGFDTLAKAAIKHGVKHFIYASSSSVYGDNGELKSPYAVSKATNELQAQVYSSLYPNIKFTGLRFFTVYGEGIRTDLAISKFIKAMKTNTPLYVYGDGTKSRDFTYVEDICEAIKTIVESDKEWKNEVFDIGYGESTSVNELIDILKSIINPNFDKVIYEKDKDYDVTTTLANTNKLYEWFGFKPMYNIKKGLIKWQLK